MLLIFKDHPLQAQERSILLSKGGQRPASMSKELLTKLRNKTEVYKRWKLNLGRI